jgi:hypothetical protein
MISGLSGVRKAAGKDRSSPPVSDADSSRVGENRLARRAWSGVTHPRQLHGADANLSRATTSAMDDTDADADDLYEELGLSEWPDALDREAGLDSIGAFFEIVGGTPTTSR